MKAGAHGAIVAGISSSVVTGWIRHRTIEEYDPGVSPPSIEDRLRQRAPLALAGLGFTGLSTVVAYSFDSIESVVLGDSSDHRPIHMQIENHRQLHSIPYIGAVVGAAHLVRSGATRFGEWIASHLNIPDLGSEISQALEGLAEWIVNGAGFGALGHLFGDIPTKGQGGTALQLLSPITDWNFCLRWIEHSAKPINQYLSCAGIVVSGAAWAVSGVYLSS